MTDIHYIQYKQDQNGILLKGLSPYQRTLTIETVRPQLNMADFLYMSQSNVEGVRRDLEFEENTDTASHYRDKFLVNINNISKSKMVRSELIRKLSTSPKYLPPFLFEWTYAGGDRGSHLSWYKTAFFDRNFTHRPIPQRICICSHEIIENCYIYNKVNHIMIVVGNCCIKKFLAHKRTCNVCQLPHQRRKFACCKECQTCGKYKLKYGDHVGKTFLETFNHYPQYMTFLKGKYDGSLIDNNLTRFLARISL